MTSTSASLRSGARAQRSREGSRPEPRRKASPEEIARALSCGRMGCQCGRWVRGTALVHCPAHGDNTPSLAVKLGANGDPAVHCHAGCDQRDVLAALGERDLWSGPGVFLPELAAARRRTLPPVAPDRPVRAEGQLGRQVAVYPYTDAGGRLLYEVVRYEPKNFRQRRPAAGGWVYNLKGVEPVPYRLPEVRSMAGTGLPVFIVEGEKDADALRGMGLCATCNSGGAGNWPAGSHRHFAGFKEVVLIPDDDPPHEKTGERVGIQHMIDVIADLRVSVRQFRLVQLTRDGRKADVSDWLAGGGDMERLLAIVRAAPAWKQTTDAQENEGT